MQVVIENYTAKPLFVFGQEKEINFMLESCHNSISNSAHADHNNAISLVVYHLKAGE